MQTFEFLTFIKLFSEGFYTLVRFYDDINIVFTE